MNSWIQYLERTGAAAPWAFLGIFIAASLLMIWRLEAMSENGFEGTVLGTLIMPYCSGIGNLIFAFLLARQPGAGAEVLTNALVNNVTNLTLLIGLPALLWQAKTAAPAKGKSKKKSPTPEPDKLHRLSVLFTLIAVLAFTGATWALSRDGQLTFNDGLVLVGLFLFWQCFHVFEVLKTNASSGKSLGWMLPLNLLLLGLGAYASYVSIDWLVTWLTKIHSGIVSAKNLGWLSGWLMVLPNALLALYYGWRRQPEVVYTSQVGDGHICVPLCVGIYALHHTMKLPDFFQAGVYLIGGATVLHMICIATIGRMPRLIGLGLVVAYGVFVTRGFGH